MADKLATIKHSPYSRKYSDRSIYTKHKKGGKIALIKAKPDHKIKGLKFGAHLCTKLQNVPFLGNLSKRVMNYILSKLGWETRLK